MGLIYFLIFLIGIGIGSIIYISSHLDKYKIVLKSNEKFYIQKKYFLWFYNDDLNIEDPEFPGFFITKSFDSKELAEKFFKQNYSQEYFNIKEVKKEKEKQRKIIEKQEQENKIKIKESFSIS